MHLLDVGRRKEHFAQSRFFGIQETIGQHEGKPSTFPERPNRKEEKEFPRIPFSAGKAKVSNRSIIDHRRNAPAPWRISHNNIKRPWTIAQMLKQIWKIKAVRSKDVGAQIQDLFILASRPNQTASFAISAAWGN